MSFANETPTSPARSAQMALVKGKDTKPEMVVRRLVHRMGYRYRLHSRDLPGQPDLTLRSRRKVIFVHGCFWHRHPGCKATRTPKSRVEFWESKFRDNVRRDAAVREALEKTGWQVLVIWECELRDIPQLENQLRDFLDAQALQAE